jgi:hypothetical protein
MPCNSDYMNPTEKERQLQETAKLYAYALRSVGLRVPRAVSKAAVNSYCGVDFVVNLCDLIRNMNQVELERVVYNGHSRESRRLADWWEVHERADEARKKKETT